MADPSIFFKNLPFDVFENILMTYYYKEEETLPRTRADQIDQLAVDSFGAGVGPLKLLD